MNLFLGVIQSDCTGWHAYVVRMCLCFRVRLSGSAWPTHRSKPHPQRPFQTRGHRRQPHLSVSVLEAQPEHWSHAHLLCDRGLQVIEAFRHFDCVLICHWLVWLYKRVFYNVCKYSSQANGGSINTKSICCGMS